MAKAAPKAPAKGGEEAPAKSKKKKLIIIAAAAVVLLGAGGGGGWYFFLHKPAAADHHKAAKEEPGKPPVYMNLEPFIVNLQQEEGESESNRYLQTAIHLQVADQKELDALKAQMPQVRDRILLLLSSRKASELITVEGKKTLAADIVAEVNKPFAPKGPPQTVSGAFFTQYIIQ